MKRIKELLRVPCMRMLVLLLLTLCLVPVLSAAARNAKAETIPAPVVQTAEQPTEQPETRVYYAVPLTREVQDHIFTECEKHGIDPAIVLAMIERESEYNNYALGDDGRAAGLMQIQAKWHLERMIALGCTDLFDSRQNITVGVDYLAEQLEKYGEIRKALTAYNRGSYSGTITEYATDVMARAYNIEQKKGE